MSNKFVKRKRFPETMAGKLQNRIDKLKKNVPEFVWENRLSVQMDGSPLDNATEKLLRECAETTMPSPVTLQTIIDNGESLSPKFPVDILRSSELRKKIPDTILESHANSVHPIIHEDALPLIADWLENKKQRGTAMEKCFYQKMGLIDLVQRILNYKAFCLHEGKDRRRIFFEELGSSRWDNIGTERQTAPLILEDYLSNDEVKLSFLITVSSHSEFVDDRSCDVPDKQPRGVFMVVNGSKFQRPTLMEYVDIEIVPNQNTVENGYGPPPETSSTDIERLRSDRRVWAKFYDQPYFPLFNEVLERWQKSPKDSTYRKKYAWMDWGECTFDAETYIKKTLITAEVILLEANARAMKLDTTAYIHVVGFGLEVYQVFAEQVVLFLEAFKIALKRLVNELRHVSDVMFAYLENQNDADELRDGGYFGHINIHCGETDTDAVLQSGKLLVVTYGLDGTESADSSTWIGKLASIGDPAVGSLTQMAELYTTQINPRASASSLHIASPKYGILHIADYAKRRL